MGRKLIYLDDALDRIRGYRGGAVDKPTAQRLLMQMDTIEECKDTISRQAAISGIVGMTTMGVEELVIAGNKEKYDWINGLSDSLVKIINLPSAQPERKKGRWIDMGDHVVCSCCGATHYGADKNYCPNCGSDNRGE